MPQRQRIAGFAAVVVRARKRDATQKGCGRGAGGNAVPQRHRIAGFAAVVVRGWKGSAAQRACREGEAEKVVPQRQRFAEFAAVVVGAGGEMPAEGRDRRGAGYRRMTETSRGPWAPMTRACSMSAVLEGPAMKLPKS